MYPTKPLKTLLALSMACLALGACAAQQNVVAEADTLENDADSEAYTESSTPETPAWSAVSNPGFSAIATATDKQDKDRFAILAMQGDYRVDFQFQETVALQAGYTLRDDKTTGAGKP